VTTLQAVENNPNLGCVMQVVFETWITSGDLRYKAVGLRRLWYLD
jgi:hypothetical protein